MNKEYIISSIFLFFCLIVLASCSQVKEVSCVEYAELVRGDYCNVVVDDFSKDEYKFYLRGENPTTNKINTFKRINYTWGYWFVDKIAKGDTIVEKRGELKFYIHKRDSVLTFPFKCKGEIYE